MLLFLFGRICLFYEKYENLEKCLSLCRLNWINLHFNCIRLCKVGVADISLQSVSLHESPFMNLISEKR